MGRSLKIEKTGTGDSASWISENMVDLWSPKHLANVDINVGAYVKTMNVNTNPANEDEMWWISYAFYDSAGEFIGETKLPIDQSTATSSGWIADTNGVGETVLPVDSWRTIISFVAGSNATGTVWADDFLLYARGDKPWLAGQNWNTAVGVPTGWFYWLPPNGGNDGVLSDGFENTVITDEQAYDGNYSLKFDPAGTHDGFVGTVKYPLDSLNVAVGDTITVSVWIKGENLLPDSVATVGDQWSVAITPILHNTYGNNAGWGEFWSSDIPLVFPNVVSFDWTQFSIDAGIQAGTEAFSVRLHPLGRFQGTVYCDKLEIKKKTTIPVGVKNEKGLPVSYELSQNFPNPFNPSTTINYSVPQHSDVSLVVYNILGSKIRTLVNNSQTQGNYSVVWNGKDDFGNSVSSGIYFYALKAGDISIVKKMILMK